LTATFGEGGVLWDLNFKVTADGRVDFATNFSSSRSRRKQYVYRMKTDLPQMEAAVLAKWQEMKPTFDFAAVTQQDLASKVKHAEAKVQAAAQALTQAQEALAEARAALLAAVGQNEEAAQ
jgi:hypothetical protein